MIRLTTNTDSIILAMSIKLERGFPNGTVLSA